MTDRPTIQANQATASRFLKLPMLLLLTIASLPVVGAVSLAAPQKAEAAAYPTASEVYVHGQPVSEYNYDRYSYDASTGTLTFIENASIQGPIEVRASGARDFTVASQGTLSLYTYSKTEGVTTDLYCIANETGGSLTLKATNGGRFMIRAQMTEEKTSIQNIAAVRCTGGVFMQCLDGAYFYIDTTNSNVVDGHAVAATHAPAYGIWAGGQVRIYGTSHAKERGTIYVKNADAELTKSTPSAAIRSDSGSVYLGATGRWYLDTRYCDGAAASIYTARNSRPNISMQNASEICAAYGVEENAGITDFFVLDGAGESWSPIEIDMYMQSGSNPSKFAADPFWNGVYFKPDDRELITGTQIVLNEVPPIGAGAQIIDNCTLDALADTPRYKLQNITGFRYKVNDDDNWQGIGDARIPEDATRVCAYFKLQANDGYRLSFDTNLVVKLPNGTLKRVTEVNTNTSGGNPAGTPSVGMYYVELDVNSDLPAGYDIESVQIEGVEAPLDGKTAKVWTQTSLGAPGDLLPAGKDRTYTWAFTNATGYPGLVIDPAIDPGYAYWVDYGVGGTGTGTNVEDGEAFQKGHEYRFVAFLYSKPGYKFPAPEQSADCSTYVNGINAVITTNVNGDPRLAKVEKTFVCPSEAIGEVAVVDVTEPVAGATAIADGKVPDDSPYSIPASSVDNGRSPQYWYEGDASIDQYNLPAEFTGTFEANKWYTYVVYLEPDVAHGYRFNTGSGTGVFQSEIAGTINGQPYAEPGKKVGNASNGPIMIRRAFYVPGENTISRIDISQTLPVAGEQSVGDAQSLTDGVTLAALGEDSPAPGATSMWIDYAGSTMQEMFMPVFQAGKTYTLMAGVDAADGWTFDIIASGNTYLGNVRAYVDGIPAGVLVVDDGTNTKADITLTYTIPKPSESDGMPIHCLYVPTGMGLSVSNDGGSTFTPTPPLADYVNIDGSGYDLHFIREDAIVEIGIWWYGSTWRAPEGDEFYKFEVIKGDIQFAHNVTNEWNRFDMPASDVVIDAVTAPAGTVPKALRWNYFDHKECNWGDPGNYPEYDNTVKRSWYVLIDGMDASDESDDYTLQPGIDYSITYEDEAGNLLAFTGDDGNLVLVGDGPVNVGQVNVTYTGIPHPGTDHPGYEGTYTDYYIIYPADISICDVVVNAEFTDGSMPYELFTNMKHEPAVTVTTPWGDELTDGDDYSVYYTDNTYVSNEVYKASAIVSGAGGNWAPYHSKEAFFEIRPQDIANDDIVWTVADQAFTGNPIDLWNMYQIRGDYNGYSLYPTAEFDITSYDDNVFPGKATITLTGKESRGFTGTKTMQFGIQASLAGSYMDYSDAEDSRTYTGSQIKPEPVVKIWAGSDSRTLVSGTDYKLEYGENTDVGYNAGVINVVPCSNEYITDSRTLYFDIAPASITDATITIPAQPYTGSEVTPEPTITFNGKTLVKDTDYVIAGYSNNTEVGVGAASVTINGINNFTDSTTVNFTIAGKNLANATAAAIPAQTYTGANITPKPAVTYDGAALTEGTDFTYSYANNKAVGTATVTIVPAAGSDFYGEKSVDFKIVKPHTVKWDRIYGAVAAETMQKIAAKFGKSNYAIVTTDASFKDALAASSLAGHYKAPVLMTKKGSLTKQTRDAIRASGAKTVIIVGTTSDVTTATQNAIKKVSGVKSTWRVNGSSASQKAVNVAKKTGTKSDTVIIVTQNDYRDALTIAPYACATESPILYTETNKKLSTATLNYIKQRKFKKAIIIGGPLALPDSVDMSLRSKGGIKKANITRIAGSTAYDTSRLIAEWTTGNLKNGNHGTYKGKPLAYVKFQPTVKFTPNNVCVSTGQNWLDALAGAALCGKWKTVMLLADSKTAKSNSSHAVNFLSKYKDKIDNGWVLGGPKAVQDGVYTKLQNATAPKVYTAG